MKKCIFCERSVMGKRILGMCPRCFNSFLQILLISIIIILFNIIIAGFAVFAITPVSAFLGPLGAL